jgi:hypothetical protein
MTTTKTMLTTVDNPFSPFDEFGAWYAYDVSSGHHTCELLGRIAYSSDQLSDVDEENSILRAIDEIVSENVSGIHRKVTKEVED